VIAVGVRFDDRVTGKTDCFACQAKIVHIDIDPTSIRKNIAVAVPVVGDCKLSLTELNRILAEEDLSQHTAQRAPWIERIDGWRNEHRLAYQQKDVIKPQYVMEKLYELTRGDAIITTEVGQNQMWAAQYYHFDHPQQFHHFRAAWEPWGSVCPRPSAPRWRFPIKWSWTSPATAAFK
jgi:acetolactate synthase I/II/III large subunit